MSLTLYTPPPGLLLEPLGELWVAYSPLSGETMMINNETAAILEILRERPGDIVSVCETLASDVGLDPGDLTKTIDASWREIIETGLIAETSPAG